MAVLNKEQALIVRLSNSLSMLIGKIEDDAKDCDAAEYATTQDFLSKHRLLASEAKYVANVQESQKTEQKLNCVFVTDPAFILNMGKLVAMTEIEEILNEAMKEYKITGIKLAATLIDSFTSDFKSAQMVRNIKLAVKSGLDINAGSLSFKFEDGQLMFVLEKDEN